MQNLVYLLLRRMRLPLVIIILSYAVSVLALVVDTRYQHQAKNGNRVGQDDNDQWQPHAAQQQIDKILHGWSGTG